MAYRRYGYKKRSFRRAYKKRYTRSTKRYYKKKYYGKRAYRKYARKYYRKGRVLKPPTVKIFPPLAMEKLDSDTIVTANDITKVVDALVADANRLYTEKAAAGNNMVIDELVATMEKNKRARAE